MKAIFHVDDPERWSLCIANAKNMAAFYHTDQTLYQIEIVANGPAVQQLVAAYSRAIGLEEQFNDLARVGVSFAACNNALNNLKISAEALFPFVTVVPAGVVELAQKQTDGYAYIKP